MELRYAALFAAAWRFSGASSVSYYYNYHYYIIIIIIIIIIVVITASIIFISRQPGGSTARTTCRTIIIIRLYICKRVQGLGFYYCYYYCYYCQYHFHYLEVQRREQRVVLLLVVFQYYISILIFRSILYIRTLIIINISSIRGLLEVQRREQRVVLLLLSICNS